MSHHTQLICIFLVAMGFHHVVQAGLKLLTSSDPHALAPQSAGITGISHCFRSIFKNNEVPAKKLGGKSKDVMKRKISLVEVA